MPGGLVPLIFGVFLLCLAALFACEADAGQPAAQVETRSRVVVESERYWLEVTIFNRSEELVWVPRKLASFKVTGPVSFSESSSAGGLATIGLLPQEGWITRVALAQEKKLTPGVYQVVSSFGLKHARYTPPTVKFEVPADPEGRD